MKRFFPVFNLALLTVLLISTPSFATHSSYYDAIEGWLVMACTQGSNITLEVRDTNNNLVDPGEIVGMGDNPLLIATDASTDEVSLSFDPSSAIAYIFYTTTGGVQLAAVTDVMSGGVQEPQISVVPSSVGFGDVSVGSTSDRTVTVSNIGTADLILGTIGVTGTYFSRQGGTCASNGQTLAPLASCTVIVRFAPGAAGSANGNLSVPSNDVNVNVPLSGNGVSQTGQSDLTISYLLVPKSVDNNVSFGLTVTVKNTGASAAGAFKVKGYFSVDTIPGNANDQLLFTWNVGSLGAGASQTNTFTVKFNGFPIHAYYNIVAQADADSEVAESNEANNTMNKAVFVSR